MDEKFGKTLSLEKASFAATTIGLKIVAT